MSIKFTSGSNITIYNPLSRSSVACIETQSIIHGLRFMWPSLRYDVTLGCGSEKRQETFEWRHSSSAAVSALRESHSGWKLVRMSGEKPAGRRLFVDSQGCEIVAVLAATGGAFRCSKMARFGFLGSGATGQLGKHFDIFAVTSALLVFRLSLRQQNNNTNAAGSLVGLY